MPTINAGQSATVTVSQNTRLDFVGSGVVTFGPGPLNGQSQTITNSGSIGPFANRDQVVYITASTVLNYNVTPQVTPVSADASNNLYANGSLVSGYGNVPSVVSGTSAASANTAAIQTALTLGGLVTIPPNLGDIYVNKTLELVSNTRVVVGLGTRLAKAPGMTMFHLARNRAAQNGCYVNGLVVSGGSITILEPGHPWAVGDTVYVENMLGNATLNGPKVVTAAVQGVSWTYAASGSNPTNTAQQLAFTSRYTPWSGSNFVRSSNVVTVQEPGHTRGVGDRLWIAGLGGTNSFNGAVEITSVVQGVSWTYASTGANETATGTAQLLGDRNIAVDWSLNGNSPNLTYQEWGSHITHWGNLTAFEETIRDCRYGIGGRVANHYNVSDVNVPYAKSSVSVAVLLQFDSFCDRVNVGEAFGQSAADDVLAWGVTAASGLFGATAAPTGPGNMGTLTVRAIQGVSATGIFKAYCQVGYDLGRMKIGRIYGTGPVSIGDNNSGVSGGTITSLQIDDIDVVPTSASSTQVGLGGGAFASMGDVTIGRIKDNALSASDTGYIINVGAPFTTLTIGKIVSDKQRTGIGVLFGSGGQLKVLSGETSTGVNGTFWLAAGASAVITSAQVSNYTHTGAGNTSGTLFYEQSAGTFQNFQFNNFVGSNFKTVTGCNSAGLTHNLGISNMRLTNVGQGFGSDVNGTFNISATNLTCVSTANNLFQFYVASTTVRITGRDISAPTSQLCLFTSTTSISIDCKDAKVDLGANGGAPPSQLVPVAGDLLTNTNATGPGVYGRTAAGAWTKVF